MKINQLRDVVAISERGGLRAAARHLKLAQPTLTRSLRELEREVGAPLFERRARGMTTTPVGELFVRRAGAVLREIERAGDEVSQLLGAAQGKVVVGLSVVAHVALLPKALQPFRERYPNVQLEIIDTVYPLLEERLINGDVDFYVGPEPSGRLAADLTQEKLFDNTRIILGRAGHPLAHAKSLRDLKTVEWATTSVTFRAEEELDALFSKNRLSKPRLGFRCQSALTLMVLLANTDLLAMVPVQWVDLAAATNWHCQIRVKEQLPAPPIVAIRRASLPLTPAAQFLLDLLTRNRPRTNPRQLRKHGS